MAQVISSEEFNNLVEHIEGIAVVDFFATWCGPCKMLAPVLEQVQDEMKSVKIVKIDIDQNPDAAAEYGVKNIPTIKIFKDGKELTTNVGFMPKESLKDMIKKTL